MHSCNGYRKESATTHIAQELRDPVIQNMFNNNEFTNQKKYFPVVIKYRPEW